MTHTSFFECNIQPSSSCPLAHASVDDQSVSNNLVLTIVSAGIANSIDAVFRTIADHLVEPPPSSEFDQVCVAPEVLVLWFVSIFLQPAHLNLAGCLRCRSPSLLPSPTRF